MGTYPGVGTCSTLVLTDRALLSQVQVQLLQTDVLPGSSLGEIEFVHDYTVPGLDICNHSLNYVR